MPHLNKTPPNWAENSPSLLRNIQQYLYCFLHSPINIITHLLRSIQKAGLALKAYYYEPLSSSMHIRYLLLWPSSNSEDSLICTLHSAPLDSLPPFEAISYVWGNNEKVAQVSCNDSIMRITASLDAVLRRLRLPDEKRTLWADSICIDQDNRKEQGNQVALMGEIYAKASKTIICLGPDPGKHAENVATLLKEITQRIESQQGSLEDNRSVPELDLHDPLSAIL